MPENALLFVLLLVAVATGWVLGVRFKREKKCANQDYIPPLEIFLASANDSALNTFLNLPKLDEDTTDLLLKLGRTLRNKGEIERSIHLHQSLFARTDLARETLVTLKLELAMDYAQAGLFDRAEGLLKDLLAEKGAVQQKAAHYLLELFEEEGSWHEIVDLYQTKVLPHDVALAKRVAHALCEQAEQAFKKRNYLEMSQLCRQALKTDNHCSRAYVLQGNLAYSQKEFHEAIRCYLRALELNDQSIAVMLLPLCDSFNKVEDGSTLLKTLSLQWSSSHYVPALKIHTQLVASTQNPAQAASVLLAELSKLPSNQGFLILLELMVQHKLSLDGLQLEALYAILRAVVEQEAKFQCTSCGFKSHDFLWRCPSCKNWSSIHTLVPRKTVNLMQSK